MHIWYNTLHTRHARCAEPQKALRAESNAIKPTGGKPKDILIWNSSVKWINIDREFQHVAHNSEMQLFESPGWENGRKVHTLQRHNKNSGLFRHPGKGQRPGRLTFT